MSINEAQFPGDIWDGLAPNRDDRQVDAGPDYEDWDQITAEVIAVQEYLTGEQSDASFGAAAGTGVEAASVRGSLNVTTITLTNAEITTTDNGTIASGSLKVFDMPAGNLVILGAVGLLSIAAGAGGLTDTAQVVMSVGSVAAAADATLTSTEANIIPSTAATLSGGANAAVDMASTAQAILDGTSQAVDVYLNVGVPDAGTSASDTLTVNGTITITWINLGDN